MAGSIGNQIANYILEAWLWENSLGAIYQARQQLSHERVTLLLLHPEISVQTSIKQYFLERIRQAELWEHPNLLKMVAAEANGRYYAIMPPLNGANLGIELQSWLQDGCTLQIEESLLLMAQIADALTFAHGKNIIHKTLNPWSILVQRESQAAGFPLRAVIYDLAIGHLQHTLFEIDQNHLKQTVPYYSPEQISGQKVDFRTDLFALGVIIYQLLTATLPFEVKETTNAMMPHLNKKPPSPRRLQSDIPQFVEEIIKKAIHKKPEKRYQSGATLAAALRTAALQLASQPTAQLRDNVVSLRTQLPAAKIGRLFIYGQDETARIFPLDKRVIIIGRSRTSDIRLPSEGVSRHHLRLEQSGTGWLVIDLNSTNGAFLEEQPISAEVAQQWPKNHALKIGPYTLKWK